MWEIGSVWGAATLEMQMNPNEFGRRLGIGVRVAGRMAQQRAEKAAQAQSPTHPASQPQGVVESPGTRFAVNSREAKEKAHKYTRAAGRGVGGFLRPFGRIGGILWLQVTGFFFGLFALFFAQDLWRTRLSYTSGPQHQRFLIAVVLVGVFGYLSISAFWRARRR
jgi:hypothetical protein